MHTCTSIDMSSCISMSVSLSLSLSLSRTALHCAAYGGFSECVSVLLEEGGATVNLQDLEGITALHWACSTGSLDVVQQLLINAGADPNLMEVDGGRLTPLDYAIIGGHQDVAQLLIENGALSISGIQELASIIIQKVVRGFLVRKKYAGVLGDHKQKEVVAISSPKPSSIEEEVTPAASVPVTSTATADSGQDRRRYNTISCLEFVLVVITGSQEALFRSFRTRSVSDCPSFGSMAAQPLGPAAVVTDHRMCTHAHAHSNV